MFSGLRCQFKLRTYQRDILKLVARESRKGQREFHIVAPPGSGKTILGLQLVIDHNHPAIVLAPNAGIQSQWVDKLRHFVPPKAQVDLAALISGDPAEARPIMALTYQGLTTRVQGQQGPDSPAEARWLQQLLDDGEVTSEEDGIAHLRAAPQITSRVCMVLQLASALGWRV